MCKRGADARRRHQADRLWLRQTDSSRAAEREQCTTEVHPAETRRQQAEEQ